MATTDDETEAAELEAALRALTTAAERARLLAAGVSVSDLAAPGFRGPAALVELGTRTRERIEAAFTLGRLARSEGGGDRAALRTSRDVVAAITPILVDEPVEVFRCLLLDARHRLLACPVISRGTLTTSLVHPREVFAPAVRARAAAIIVAHNHPSGDPSPSQEDHGVTARLAAAGRLLGIPLLDHVIVGAEGYHAYRESRPAMLDA